MKALKSRPCTSTVPILLLILLLASHQLFAENFRGEISRRIDLDANGSTEVPIGAGEIILLAPSDESRRFVNGVDLVVASISPDLPSGAYTIAVYGGVDAPEEPGYVNLAGTSLGTIPPSRGNRYRIHVPFSSDTRVSSEAGLTITAPADLNTGPVAVQLVPIMKGMNDADLDATFRVEVSPRLRPVGALVVSLAGESAVVDRASEILTVRLDGSPVEPDQLLELEPGIYRLEAQAGDFLTYTSNVGIERGRVRQVVLEATEPRATIRVSVPSVADVYWNGSLLASRRDVSVSPGTHSLMIRLGDFSVSREVELAANERYVIGIDLDILLNQD
jgi:hypothetical protein